jgi:chromosomal replication initiator protein
VQLNPQLNFRNFVIGKSNRAAYDAAYEFAVSKSQDDSLIYIHGGVGVGKSHLAQAIGNCFKNHTNQANVVCFHSSHFINFGNPEFPFIELDEFLDTPLLNDLVILDEIEYFPKNPLVQQSLIKALGIRFQYNKRVVIVSRKSPCCLNGFDPKFIELVGKSKLVAIEAPDIATRIAFIEHKSNTDNYTRLDAKLATFVATNVVGDDFRELEYALRRISASAQFTKSGATIEVLNKTICPFV